MTEFRRREPVSVQGHAPTYIGGAISTIFCQCGWTTKRYARPDGAWHEYRQHKNTIRKPHLNQVGLSSSQENP